jgi:hypothetical protein
MPNELSRRDFTKGLATVASTLPIMAATSSASNSAEPDKSKEAERPDPVRSELAVWLELIHTRYPSERMTPEVMTLIAGDVLGDIMHCRKVSSFPLQNSHAPAFVFKARRSEV